MRRVEPRAANRHVIDRHPLAHILILAPRRLVRAPARPNVAVKLSSLQSVPPSLACCDSTANSKLW